MEETFEKYCFREKFDDQIKVAFLPTVTFQECKKIEAVLATGGPIPCRAPIEAMLHTG